MGLWANNVGVHLDELLVLKVLTKIHFPKWVEVEHSHLTMQKIYTFYLLKYYFIYFTFLFNNLPYISVFFLQFIPLKQSIKSTPTTISKNNNNKLSHQQEHNVLLKKKKHSERERQIKNTKKKIIQLAKGGFIFTSDCSKLYNLLQRCIPRYGCIF